MIPARFLVEHNIVLSAIEIDFAISRKLINLTDLSQIVDLSLLNYPNDKRLLNLALDLLLDLLLDEFYGNADITHSWLDNVCDNKVSDKWRYIILLWLFKNRDNNSSDYDKINTVYANFDYPSDMERFINYMPIQEKNGKSGCQNILDNWKEYLDINKHLIEF